MQQVVLDWFSIGALGGPLIEQLVWLWAAADGLKIPLATSANWAIQNRYYNG